ncbi:MAG: hypothetical protein OXG35_06175 [Acidobacteria bacterium]|nr:hypothetical protein [Acidobacteriota bacterium]
MAFVRSQFPRMLTQGGPLSFCGWMHRTAFPDAPPMDPAERDDPAAHGVMVLYAPTERFPEHATLAGMRQRLCRPDPKDIANADDMIVTGALADGVTLDRDTFDPGKWAVLPDFLWPEIELDTAHGAD